MSLKRVLAVALGILSAIGGFVDIGDLVFNTQAGAAFGFQLLWVVVIGVVAVIQRASLSLVPGQRIEPAGLSAMYPRFSVRVAVESVGPCRSR